MLLDLSELGHGPLSLAQTKVLYFQVTRQPGISLTKFETMQTLLTATISLASPLPDPNVPKRNREGLKSKQMTKIHARVRV